MEDWKNVRAYGPSTLPRVYNNTPLLITDILELQLLSGMISQSDLNDPLVARVSNIEKPVRMCSHIRCVKQCNFITTNRTRNAERGARNGPVTVFFAPTSDFRLPRSKHTVFLMRNGRISIGPY